MTSAVRRLPVFGAMAALALVAGACSGGDQPKASPKRPPATTPTVAGPSTTRPDPPIPKGAVIAPLTGLPVKEPLTVFRQALVVKIDNVDIGRERARPQEGVAAADVVFEEIVEGGITRLVAVFQSALPGRVGPVRSARTTDPKLVAQLHRPLFAYAGGNPGVLGAVRDAPLVDMSSDWATSAYQRDHDRRAPHNLFVHPGELYALGPEKADPPPALFTFRAPGEPLLPTAAPLRSMRLDFGGIASVPVTSEYDVKADGWRRGQAGTTHTDADGRVVVPRNVVVLFTDYQPSPADLRSPEAQTVGGGEAWVLSKGKIVKGTWKRESADRPANLTDPAGQLIKLTPGKTWVELARPGQATLTG